MTLVPSPRHRSDDIAHWKTCEREDHLRARLRALERKEQKAIRELHKFAQSGPCYVGVSWGKDSTVAAHLAWRLFYRETVRLPLVWVRVEPICSPECGEVRDRFLRKYPLPYDEIVVHCLRDSDGWHAKGTLERGFALARERYGERHVSGIRGEESSGRNMRMKFYGIATAHTCAPIGWWQPEDVFAYLYKHKLPVHPAYAMTRGGLFDRRKIRVASLGGKRGAGFGRVEWELAYYPDLLREICGDREVIDGTT